MTHHVSDPAIQHSCRFHISPRPSFITETATSDTNAPTPPSIHPLLHNHIPKTPPKHPHPLPTMPTPTPPPSLAQSQPLQPPPSSTTWPPPPPPTTTSDPITLETWGPVFYEPKRRKPHGEQERKVKNGYLEPLSPTSSSESDSEPDPACEKKNPKRKTEADTKKHKPRPGNAQGTSGLPKPDLELSGQEERHTTETIENIPASEGGGGGVRKTYVTTIRITTVRVERPFVEREGHEKNEKKKKKDQKDKQKKDKKITSGDEPTANGTPPHSKKPTACTGISYATTS